MIQSKELSLKTIIHSKEGVHLTSYLENRGNVNQFKKQIRESIEVATEHLSSIMPEKELRSFIAPLSQLLSDTKILKSFKSNIGLFRTRDSFRMLSIPIGVDHLCVVATSFHVKPLLRWIQADKEFLLLGLEKGSASLYLGTQSSLRHIDTIIFPEVLLKENSEANYSDLKLKKFKDFKFDETLEWLNEWIYEITGKNKVPLFVAGAPDLTKKLYLKLRYSRVRRKPILNSFNQSKLTDAIAEARNLLQRETKQMLEKSLVEFYWAEDMKLGKKNIFQIAKAAVQGKIRKLIVADGVQIFGKLDRITGGLSINPVHLDHEDDDLLDDLSQTVLASGGEVIVVPREQIPKGRPILAILKGRPNQKTSEVGPEILEQVNYA
ncbi:MAG: hypothetical protein KDD40_02390 [Bdellovibrionales bacterium]|nr:hypothetical protein [Bdellovibrionales bacterium]